MKSKMKKSISMMMVFAMAAMLCINNEVNVYAGSNYVVAPMQDDQQIIPDKYNTGCKGELIHFEDCSAEQQKQIMGGIELKKSDEYYAINFTYSTIAPGNYVIENVDFSNRTITDVSGNSIVKDDMGFRYLGSAKDEITITFNNCKFGAVIPGANVKTTFNNCSFKTLNGSDVVCNNCQFGHSPNDPIRPFNRTWFNDCYITDLQYFMNEREQHIDGVQIYGNLANKNAGETKGKDAGDIHFKNCRFEIPTYYIAEGNTANMNNCIFVQIEYSDAYDITFEDIITNGAGFQFSAHQCKCPDPKGWALEGVSLKNCRMGEGSIYRAFTAVDDRVELENSGVSIPLYVGSSWKGDDGKTHFSVTNDSSSDRKITIISDKEVVTRTIPRFPTAKETNVVTNTLTYADYPIDLDIAIEADKYAVCFDSTFEMQQIRFVNYSGEQVVLDADVLKTYETPSEVIKEGSCGTKKSTVTYSLTNDGILTISGEGDMINFHSGLTPPWANDVIRKVIVEEGVTSIGNQAFNGRDGILEISLPDSLLTIGGRAFNNCCSIREIILPANLQSVGNSSFDGLFVAQMEFLGEDPSAVKGLSVYAKQIKDYPAVSENTTPDPKPSEDVSTSPSSVPSTVPSEAPSEEVSTSPSSVPSTAPSEVPSKEVSTSPSSIPSEAPSKEVSTSPSSVPSKQPSISPVVTPSEQPNTIQIMPAKTKVKKVKAGHKQLVVTVQKKKQNVTGYQIQIATNKKFTKNVKKAVLKKNTTTKKVFKKLKENTGYYIRVRTYLKSNGKKYYSAWTKYKKKVMTK